MTTRRSLIIAVLVGLVALTLPGAGKVQPASSATVPIFQNPTYSFAERAADLVARMSVAQVASQTISSQSPAISTLAQSPGITGTNGPVVSNYGWWNESLHGVARLSILATGNAETITNTTSYPDNNAMGSTWDPTMVYNVASAISDEAREVVPDNEYDLDFYAPTINLARDPRWGRNDETWSEDPLVTADLAAQYVNGMQGQDMNGNLLPSGDGYYKTLTTLKHFAAYNSESNRTSGSDDEDARTLMEYDLAPFRMIVASAHPASVMSAYTEVNEIPSPADDFLMDTLLRQTFGFTGYVTADCDAVYEIVAGHDWQPPDWTRPLNNTERNGYAMATGEDLDCDAGYADGNTYLTRLPEAVGQGIVTSNFNYTGYTSNPGVPLSTGGSGSYSTEEHAVDTYTVNDLDVSATRLFTARMETGEFDNQANVPWATQAQARYTAEGGTTPYTTLNPTTRVGTITEAPAGVTETPARLTLARQAGDEAIVLLKNNGNILPLKVPSTGTYNVAVVGPVANPASLSTLYLGDYASTQTTAGLANVTDDYAGLKAAIQAINPNANVTYIRGYAGTSNTVSSLGTSADALDTSNPPDANSIYNLTETSAGAPLAQPYNAVVVATSTDSTTGTEAMDRTAITLPGSQQTLVQDVSALTAPTSIPTIVYMETLGPMDVTGFDDPTPYDPTDTQVTANPGAVLWSGYNGQEMGQSLADVITGAYDPTGRLASTWYHDVSDLPNILDYDIRPNGPHGNNSGAGPTNGRTYMYYNGPLSYPFGYGLSYTTFSYSNLQISNPTPTANGSTTVSVNVTNTGSVAGGDVVQMYVNQPNAPAALQRPIERLEGFQLVRLNPGQTQTVTFTLNIPSLEYFNAATNLWGVDDGEYGIMISSSSAAQDVQQAGTINVSGSLTPTLSVLSAKPNMAGDAARDIQQRVMYPIGVTVLPNLTASFSDNSMYGNIEIGQSTPFPAGMTFSYSSDQPSVVSVSPSGTITTVANGVATITATATYQGVSKSASFVVRVLSMLNGITVNGTPLSGFTPDTYNYDMVLPNQATVPTIAATDPDPGATVSITQAPGVPGTATIVDTGSDGIVLTYTINFAYGAISDDFTSPTLGSQWNIVRPDSTHWSLTQNPGELTLTPEAGDLSASAATLKNLFVQPALGNWTVTSKLNFSTSPTTNEEGGIIAYQNDQNFLKLYWGSSGIVLATQDNLDGGTPINATLATVSTTSILGTGANKTLWLRIAKLGPSYSAFYSTNGTTFVPIYQDGQNLTDLQVGVYAEITTGTVTNNLTVGVQQFSVTTATTAASLSPTPVDGYENKSPTTVTLTPTDPGGPGILSTYYQVDNQGYQLYTGPFTVSGDGTHQINYYSVDLNGAQEAPNTQYVTIDTEPPVTTASVSPTPSSTPQAGTVTGPATVSLTATDTLTPDAGTPPPHALPWPPNAPSGVAITEYQINGVGPDGTANTWFTYTGPFTISTGGAQVVTYRSIDNAGNVEATHTLTLNVNPQVSQTYAGTVASQVALALGNGATLGNWTFLAGQAGTYTASTTATITSTATSSALTVADTSTTAPGHLVNGAYSLPQALQMDATDAAHATGTFQSLGATPVTLLTYAAPVSSDAVTVNAQQPIAATDALHTGTYSKTFVFTVSVLTP